MGQGQPSDVDDITQGHVFNVTECDNQEQNETSDVRETRKSSMFECLASINEGQG
jgi:hypothetical protein